MRITLSLEQANEFVKNLMFAAANLNNPAVRPMLVDMAQTLQGAPRFSDDVELPPQYTVLEGTRYGGTGSLEMVGSYVAPTEEQVKEGVAFGNLGRQTGKYAGGDPANYPDAMLVLAGIEYGDTESPIVGTLSLPADTLVLAGERYGAMYGEHSFTGHLSLPDEPNVKTGTGYGINTEGVWSKNGSYNPLFPEMDDVQEGIEYGDWDVNNPGHRNRLGYLVVPAQTDVKSGVTYGAFGNEFTGTYAL